MNAFKVSTAAVASALMLFATTASTMAQTDKGAKQYAPGQERKPGESAKKYAPGQNKPEGESAKDQAPGQQMNKKK